MSTHTHESAQVSDHHHDFDPEPIKTIPTDEPHSPIWLPLVGLCIAAAVSVPWITKVTGQPEKILPAETTVAKPIAKEKHQPPKPMTSGEKENTVKALQAMSPEKKRQIGQSLKDAQKRKTQDQKK